MSVGDPEDFEIYLPSAPYLGLLQNIKLELMLPDVFVSAFLREIHLHFNETYKNDIIKYYTPLSLWDTKEDILKELIENKNMTYHEAHLWFCNHWANETSTQDNPYLDAMKISVNKSSNIGIESCMRLYSKEAQYSLVSLSNRSYRNSSIHLWADVERNHDLKEKLMEEFILNEGQVKQVFKWLQTLKLANNVVIPSIESILGIDSFNDMDCIQWGQGLITQESISSIYPETFELDVPEFYHWSTERGYNFTSFRLEACKLMFRDGDGHKSIFDPKALLSLKSSLNYAILTGDYTYLKEKWNIGTYDEAQALVDYFSYLSSSYSKARIDYWLKNGSGIIVKRKASEWLWNYKDPIVSRLNPLSRSPNFKHNRTSEDDARINTKFNIVHTGVGNISNIQRYFEWQEQSEINWMYPRPITVEGSTELGQFKPSLVSSPETLLVFQEEYMKTLKLIKTNETKIKGKIDSYVYTVDNSTWFKDESMYNFIDGFWNTSAKFNNSPILLGKPHFNGAEDHWRQKIIGIGDMNDSDITRIYVEPWTGRVVKLEKSVQINLHISDKALWFTGSPYHPNMITDIILPTIWVSQKMVISDPLAEKIVTEVYGPQKLRVIIKFATFGVAALLGIASVILLVTTIKKYRRQREGYDFIN